MPTCNHTLFLSRRHFFTRTVAAAGIAGIIALGAKNFVGESRATGQISQVLSVAEASEFATLDAQFVALGRPRIEARLQNGTVEKKIYALEWIELRGHKPLYDLICMSMSDASMKVREVALRLLLSIDPVLLKPHIEMIQTSVPAFKRKEIRSILIQLLNDVELS